MSRAPTVRLPLEHWGLRLRRGDIHAGSLNLNTLADRAGTPFYLFDEARLRRNMQSAMTSALLSFRDCELFYPLKANPYPRVLEIAKEEGFGAEVISAAELRAARRAHVSGNGTVFNGPGKTSGDLALAIRAGALIHVESASEAEELARLARGARRVVRAGIRVNPDVYEPRSVENMRMGCGDSVFGLAPKGAGFRRAVDVLSRARNVRLESLSAHIGSGIVTAEPFGRMARALASLWDSLARRGIEIGALDFGGGCAVKSEVRYSESSFDHFHSEEAEKIPAPEDIVSFPDVCGAIASAVGERPVRCLLEHGRLLVSDAFHLVTRVVRIKEERGVRYAVVDAGRVQNAIFAGRGFHEMVPLRPRARRRTYTVTGPLCANFDAYCHGRSLPELSEGDVLALLNVGAYNLSAQSRWSFEPARVVTLTETGRILADRSQRA